MRKGLWSPDEDEKLKACIAQHRSGSWSDIARKAGLQRCGKSCRRRWMNHLRPDLKQEKFTSDEIRSVAKLHEMLGNKWSEIATYLVGRTDNDVKNLWNTQIKRQRKSGWNHEDENKLVSMPENSRVQFPFSIEEFNNECMGKGIMESSNYLDITKSATSSTITSTTTNGVDSDQWVNTSHSIDDALDLSSFYTQDLVHLDTCNQLVFPFTECGNCDEQNSTPHPISSPNVEHFFNFDTPGNSMMESNLDSIEYNESATSYSHILEGTSSDESSINARSILDDGCSVVVGQSSMFDLKYQLDVMQRMGLDLH